MAVRSTPITVSTGTAASAAASASVRLPPQQ
jgi:hypothetical protein